MSSVPLYRSASIHWLTCHLSPLTSHPRFVAKIFRRKLDVAYLTLPNAEFSAHLLCIHYLVDIGNRITSCRSRPYLGTAAVACTIAEDDLRSPHQSPSVRISSRCKRDPCAGNGAPPDLNQRLHVSPPDEVHICIPPDALSYLFWTSRCVKT